MKKGLWEHVIERDARWCWYWSEDKVHHHVTFREWRASHPVVCVVPILDPTNRSKCGGKQTVEHVKDQLMMGKKAPDDEFHLLACCMNHNSWNPPSKVLRQKMRTRLRELRAEAASD